MPAFRARIAARLLESWSIQTEQGVIVEAAYRQALDLISGLEPGDVARLACQYHLAPSYSAWRRRRSGWPVWRWLDELIDLVNGAGIRIVAVALWLVVALSLVLFTLDSL